MSAKPSRTFPLLVVIALLANAVFEIGAGVLILFSPASVFPGAGPHAAAIGRTLACTAISAGGLGLVLLLARENGRAFRAAFAAIGVFHLVVAVGHGAAVLQDFTVPAAPIFHGALALLFGVALLTGRPARNGQPWNGVTSRRSAGTPSR